MRRTLEALRGQFDRVVIDAPPAVPLADVSILIPMVDRVLLVVRAGVTMKPAIHDAVASIDPSKLIGLVLNEAL
jgi:Mrp family chromosome partitioning ATPase